MTSVAYTILLIILSYTIFMLFAESILILRRWKNMTHGYLFLNCLATLINNIGFLLEMTSKSQEAKIIAVQFRYTGAVWIALTLLAFITKLCRVRMPGTLARIMVGVNLVIYGLILTVNIHPLYYSKIWVESYGTFSRLRHTNGIVHHFNMALQIIYIILGLIWLIMALLKEKDARARNRFLLIISAALVEGLFFVAQIVNPFGLKGLFDVTVLGYFFSTTIMLVAILAYDLLGTEDIARDFVMDRLSEGVIAADTEGRVQYFNKTARRLYPEIGMREAGIPGEVIRAAMCGDNIEIEGRVYAPEVNSITYNGENYGTLYALVDETDHIRYMKELEEQKELADNANKAKSRFLANMSHEIRTPINAVLGMDEMILRESKESTIRTYAADIRSAGRTLLSLINDILDLSKVEEGKMELIPVQYELTSLINDLCNMIRDRAISKGLRFNVDVDGRIPHLLIGDEVRIRQCVLNILTNAVKYTEDGYVCLKVSFEKKDDQHIMLSFAVEDTGIGMKQEEVEYLFSPYKRLDGKKTRTIEGTGLGMSITKQLLELMGSGLNVDSEYGKGSTLSFEVKQEVVSWDEIGDYAERYSDPGRDPEAYHELFHAPDARILVVDDTEVNHTVIQNLLKKTAIRIDTALSGKDALTLAGVNKYDVIFIDHMMPEMDGIETLQHLKEEGRNTDTPAVALTANAVSGARKMFVDAGFTDYVSKPVDGEKLEKLLYVLLPDDLIEKASPEDAVSADSVEEEISRILVIDDDEAVCTLIKNIMEPAYEVEECRLGKEAVSKAKKTQPDLIMLDIHLEDSNGFVVMEELKKESMTEDIPVLLLTGDNDSVTEENGFRSGAADYIRKPFVPDVLKQRVKRIVTLHHYQKSIEEEVDRQTRRSRRLSREMMLALSKTVDTKDHYTDGHSRRVAAMSAEIARRLGKSSAEQVMIYEIGLLHDIGKIGVHEDIIHKDSRLTDNEYLAIKEHTLKGYEILKEIEDMPRLREGARSHHEHFDGRGYPDGLKGYDIPETARIVCVADCYDAMTSTRSYSKPREQADVRAEIERCSGTWFDPEVAEVMLSMIDEDKEYRMNESAESGDVWKEYDRLWGDLGAKMDGEDIGIKGSLPSWIRQIPDVDAETGIKNCGSEDGYLSVLTVFHQTAAAKADEIESLFEDDNIPDYTIRVHALKSSARIIGAGRLSKLAEELEMAGKEGNTDLIKEHTGRLLEMYRDLDSALSGLASGDEELPAIDDASVKDAYRTMIEIADSMDYGLMDDIIKSLRGYRLSERDEKNIKNVEKQLSELDWEGIKDTAGKALEEMEDQNG